MLTRTAFAKRLKEQVLVLDGGTGTLLQEWGLPRGTAPESWNLDRPEAIGDVHRTYIASGADVVLTNTFGATRLKLEAYGLEGRLAAINAAAVRIAKKEAAGKAWVGVSVGPLGKSLYPLGDLTFDQAFELFAEQMKIVRRAKPDLIVLETFADLREARAAALAARDHFEGPILAQMTFSEGDATLTGVKARAAAIALEALDLDAVGANCSLGPEELFPVMEEMAKATDLPLLVQPNAGLPELRSGRTVFPGGPDLFEKWAPRFAAIGVNLLGGCCGTGPEHIQAIRGAVRGIAPLRRRRPEGSRICGRSQAVELGAGRPAALLGERINPTARKSIREAILGGAWHVLRAETEAQAKAGACAVDVNVGAPGADEAEAMQNAVRAVQSAAGLPLCLDSSDPAVLERGLKEVEGKCLLNSTTADEGKVRKLAALARRYGAALVGLTLDEKGIPEDAEGRLRLAARIVKGCEAAGLRREDVFIDPIILSTGTDARQARECLQAIERIKQTLGVPVVLGVSNVSHGMPGRPALNATFLSMALARGLDLPIADPGSEEIRQALVAGNLLLGRDPYGKAYLAGHETLRKGGPQPTLKKAAGAADLAGRIREAVLEGDGEGLTGLVEKALASGWPPLKVSDVGLLPALQEVGRRFK
ncbi:MAG: homocysteine S-methyltransferase family protein, partial [Planctomycetes bacterium]|nr:homocysteine S-methyltransferase family protein [Planctomycetota bacterium]